jgi:hypothetical protein
MPDVSTEVAIATTTVSGSSTTTIQFGSIPSTYTDLRVILVGTLPSDNGVRVQFNNNTGTNYSYTSLRGNGTAASSSSATNSTFIDMQQGWYWNSASINHNTLDIFSYTGSTFKTSLTTASLDWNGSGATTRQVGLWRSTSAITTITFTTTATNFSAGTTATLYGIL